MILSILLALAGGAPSPAAGALSIEEYRRLPVCQLSPDGMRLLREPCRSAPPRASMPRRPVPQTISPTPRIAPALAPAPAPDPALSWAPVLAPPAPPAPSPASPHAPAPPRGAVVTPSAAPLPGPSAPIPVLCGAGGCRDASGTYYHGAPGQVVSPAGKVCSQLGGFMICN